jgi:hypothetical protein
MRMFPGEAGLLLAGGLVLLLLGSSQEVMADCPVGCEYCSADPVFIQADARRPELLALIREAKSRGATVADSGELLFIVEEETPVVDGDK